MTLVTPKRIRAAYTMLQQCPPFDRWRLPPPDALRYTLLSSPTEHAEYMPNKRRHRISVNVDTHTTLEQLLASTAHEMVHLRQELLGRLPAEKNAHNAEFRRLARMVCQHLGFNVQTF